MFNFEGLIGVIKQVEAQRSSTDLTSRHFTHKDTRIIISLMGDREYVLRVDWLLRAMASEIGTSRNNLVIALAIKGLIEYHTEGIDSERYKNDPEYRIGIDACKQRAEDKRLEMQANDLKYLTSHSGDIAKGTMEWLKEIGYSIDAIAIQPEQPTPTDLMDLTVNKIKCWVYFHCLKDSAMPKADAEKDAIDKGVIADTNTGRNTLKTFMSRAGVSGGGVRGEWNFGKIDPAFMDTIPQFIKNIANEDWEQEKTAKEHHEVTEKVDEK